ncbi:MAG: hypothetical protein ACXU8U_00305 [Asticcacaulis sp.]
MGAIADSRLSMIKGLVKSLPQSSLRSLELALGLTRDAPLVEVRDLISQELECRGVRDAVFAPYLPLLQSRQDGLNGVEFERWIIDNLWTVLQARESDLVEQARHALRGLRAEDPTPVPFFRLVTAGVAICRDEPDAVLPPKPGRNDRAEIAEFACYLDLHRILRTALAKLPEFMGRIDAEKAAALRLMFKDACDLDEGSGSRFLEVLFACLDDGSQIIKFVATVSDRPNDRFLASSELADFGERILDQIEERLAALKLCMGGRGKTCDDLHSAGARISQCLAQMQALETYIELSRDGPWGKRCAEAHKQIAQLVEDQLKTAENIVADALPMKSERVYGRMKKDVPRLDKPLKPEVLEKARVMLHFIRDIRATAASGGYASLHAKTMQALEAAMDAYLEELLSLCNGEDAVDPDAAMAAFEVVTDLMEALCGEEKAQVGRRRVASCDLFKPNRKAG